MSICTTRPNFSSGVDIDLRRASTLFPQLDLEWPTEMISGAPKNNCLFQNSIGIFRIRDPCQIPDPNIHQPVYLRYAATLLRPPNTLQIHMEGYRGRYLALSHFFFCAHAVLDKGNTKSRKTTKAGFAMGILKIGSASVRDGGGVAYNS